MQSPAYSENPASGGVIPESPYSVQHLPTNNVLTSPSSVSAIIGEKTGLSALTQSKLWRAPGSRGRDKTSPYPLPEQDAEAITAKTVLPIKKFEMADENRRD
jgi:hypothetical protein